MKTREFFTMLALMLCLSLLGYLARCSEERFIKKEIDPKILNAYFLGKSQTLKTVRSVYDLKQNHETALSFLTDLQVSKDTAILLSK